MIPDILFSHAAMQLKSHAVCEPILSVFLYVSHIAFQTKEEIWAKTMDPFFQGEPSWGDLLQDFRSQELRVRHRFSAAARPTMARVLAVLGTIQCRQTRILFRGANATSTVEGIVFSSGIPKMEKLPTWKPTIPVIQICRHVPAYEDAP